MLTIYKASAGSGKTYQLAKEYIRALIGVKPQGSDSYYLNLPKYNKGYGEANNRHRYILAITFTNKATEEMKRRIIDELDALYRMPITIDGKVKEANYAKEFCSDFGCTRAELSQAAQKALDQLLNDYSQFNVTTIDSFFQRVLRTFARELDRQGDFAVELNDTLAVQTSVGLMLDEYNRNATDNKALGAWIYDYLLRQIEDGSKSNFFNRKSHLFTSLVSMVSRICEEKFKRYATRMRDYLEDPSRLVRFKADIRSRQQDLIQTLARSVCSTLKALAAQGVALDMMTAKYTKLKDNIEIVAAGRRIDKSYALNDTILKISQGETNPFYKKYGVQGSSLALFSTIGTDIRAAYIQMQILNDMYDAADGLALLSFAWCHLQAFVNDNNMVLLSDTNHLLQRIIGGDDTPFIYERMGVQFRNFLIDEFQDTSRMQWDNLLPLVSNSLGADYDSLIIGDEKQSIYRFRNSDSSLLHTQVADHDFAGPQYRLQIKGNVPEQNTNWRSAADIVRFNNTLFQTLARNLEVEGFENVVQGIAKTDLDGYVRFVNVTEATDDTHDHLDMMAAEIMRQHTEGGYPWSHIAILTYTNDEGAKAIDRIINKYPQIPVLSDEALYVRKSHAVQTVLSMLKILANEASMPPADDGPQPRFPSATEVSVMLNRFSYYRNRGMDDNAALDLALSAHGPHAGESASIVNCLHAIKARKPSTLTALVETIIHEMVTPEQRSTQIAYLTAFQDYVMDFCSRNNPSLRSLLSNWESAKHRLSVPAAADIDAVRVMTIHKSKGLEFDCVHIPFASWREVGKPRGTWMPVPAQAGFDPEVCPPALYIKLDTAYGEEGSYYSHLYAADAKEREADVMNMTYVAYTRAARELIVYYDPSKGIAVPVTAAFAMTYAVDDPRLCPLATFFDTDTQQLVIGSPTHYLPPVDKGQSATPMEVDAYNVYIHDGAKVLTQVEDMLEADTAGVDDDGTDEASPFVIDEESRRRGIIYHEILARIRGLDDLDRAIHATVIDHRLTASEQLQAKVAIRQMLGSQDERIHRWFIDYRRVLNEQSILLPEGYEPPAPRRDDDRDIDYRRPDRIVFHDNGVDVVDYKFTTGERPSHKAQVREYIDILRRMGYDNVRGYLWYPLINKIIEL